MSRDVPINSDGLWAEIMPDAVRQTPALFLDRDGVLVQEVDYLSRVEDIAIVEGAAATIKVANSCGIAVVLVTNQSGIARGYYGWDEFAKVQQAILASLWDDGARIDAVYACPFHANGQGVYAYPDHPGRKPNPGMLLQAAADLEIDLARSWMVGDRVIDIEAARRAGLAGALHVLTGYGDMERVMLTDFTVPGFDLRFGSSIIDAVSLPVMRMSFSSSRP